MDNKQLAADIGNFRSLQDRRYTWNVLYQKIADFMIPERADFTIHRWPGQRRNYNIYDSTAIWAGQMLSAGLHSMLTSPGAPWFYLTTGDPDLDERQDVQEWLQAVQTDMNSVFNDPVANFQSQIHELYLDLVYFGTAVMYVNYHDRMTFRTLFLGECYVDQDMHGMINRLYRLFPMTKGQILQRFGDKVDYGKDFNNAKSDSQWEVLNVVVPANENATRFTNRHWILKGEILVEDKTYAHFPYVVPRWEKSSAEIMGRSPAMTALPEVLGANAIKRDVITASALKNRPPLQAPSSGYITPISIAPGHISYYDSTSPGRLEPIPINADPDAGNAELQDSRKAIMRAFHTEMLMLPGQDQPGGQNPYMSATEATIRRDNQLRLIGPVLSRLQHELLGPLVHRVYRIMHVKKLLPEAPAALADVPLSVEYRSPLAIAQKAAQGENLMRALSIVQPIAGVNPGILDTIDGEAALRWAFSITHTPQSLLLTKQQMAQMRAQQQAAQQQQVAENKNAMDAKRNLESASAISKLMKAQT